IRMAVPTPLPTLRRLRLSSIPTSELGITCHSLARRFARSAGGHQPAGLGQAKGRHARIDRLVRAGVNLVGLVPDAHVAACLAYGFVEFLPGRQVKMIARFGIAFEIIEAAPILHDHRPAERVAQAAETWIGIKLLEHRPHGTEHWPPGW